MKRLSCLAHDKDQTDEVWCDILRKASECEPWVFQAKTRNGFGFVFARAVEAVSHSMHKYTKLKKKKQKYRPTPILRPCRQKIINHNILMFLVMIFRN